MYSLSVALLLLFAIRQFLDILAPIILNAATTKTVEEPLEFAIFDIIYLLTIGFSLKSKFCYKRSEELFWMGLYGIGQVAFGWIVIGANDPILLYMISFYIAIGPVLSICLMVDDSMEKNESARKTTRFE